MKLIYIDNARIPTEKAHGVHIMKMCEALANIKIEEQSLTVELIVPKRINKIKENPFNYYDVEKNFKITKIPCIDLSFFWPNFFTFYLQKISFIVILKFFLIFKKYDILYTREQFMGLLFRKYIVESHIYKDSIIYRLTWKNAAKIITVTSFLKDKILSIGKKEVYVAPDAVDFKKFNISVNKREARKELRLPEDKLLIGYVGMFKTMGVEKGVDVSIRSLIKFKTKTYLVLVGGSKEDILFYQNLVDKLGLSENVIFAGKVPHSVVPVYLKAFDILIAPFPDLAHFRYYMSPLKIFEYMAAKRPIVVTDLPSIREVLDEKSAVFVKPNSQDDLIKGIEKLIENENFRDSIASHAHKIAEERFTWEKRAFNILNFILN